jgi:hypothetical protein
VKNKFASVVIAGMAASTLSACTPAPDAEQVSSNNASSKTAACDSKNVERYISKRFTAVLAEQMRKEADAAIVRTGPKDGPVTMDYIPARLNVFFDDAMLIAVVNCG